MTVRPMDEDCGTHGIHLLDVSRKSCIGRLDQGLMQRYQRFILIKSIIGACVGIDFWILDNDLDLWKMPNDK